MLGCNRVQRDCQFSYQLDQGSVIALGSADANRSAATTGSSSTAIRTRIDRLTPPTGLTNASSATFRMTCTMNDSAVALIDRSKTTIQYKVDGAASWSDVRSSTGFNLTTQV